MGSKLKEALLRNFHIQWSALIEIVGFLTIALIIDWIFGLGDRFYTVSPHPFWIIVLLVTVQYGTAEGIVAAVLASFALLVGNLPVQSSLEDFYQYWMAVSATPILWLCTAMILGELSNRHICEKLSLRTKKAKHDKREETLVKAYERLERHREKLEKVLASQKGSAVSILEALKQCTSVQPQRVLAEAHGLIKATLNPDQFSIFVLSNKGLVLDSNFGWISPVPYASKIKRESALYKELVKAHRFLCCTEKGQALILGKEGLLAGPILDKSGKRVLGVLKIENINFYDLNVSTVETFRLLCEWIGKVYCNAVEYQFLLETGLHPALGTEDELWNEWSEKIEKAAVL